MLPLSISTCQKTTVKLLQLAILMTFVGQSALAQIYKCEEASGKVNFQDHPCTKGITKEFTLRKSNTMDKNKQLDRYKINTGNTTSKKKNKKNTTVHPYDGQNKMMCDSAREAYELEVSQIKARCKKGRETFCNKSAEEIQKEWDRNYLKKQRGDAFTQPSRQWHAFNQNGGAPIFSLKAQIKQYCKN